MEWTPPHPRRLPTTWEIHENRGKIRELDAKIADLKEQLEKLQRDRDVCTSFISSFRRLPAEILCEIVLQAINKGQSPIRLSEVSASVRDAIIGMKQLWTTIYLYARHPHYPVTYFFCRNREWLRVLLDRSAPLPLTVTIDDPPKVAEMMEELRHSSASIETLRVIINNSPQFNFPAYDLRRLQHLHLKPPLYSTFDATKLLDLIQIEGNTSFKLSLDGSGPSARTIVEHRVFQNLVHAVFYTQPTTFLPEGSRMVFPMLETLDIASPVYLQRFELPMLRSLSVKGTTSSWDSDEYESLLWIESIPEGITSLRIRDVVLFALHPQRRSFGNLAKIEMSLDLGVDLNVRDRFFAPRLKEVKISRAQLHRECNNNEDIHLQLLGIDGLLARSPITHVHVGGINTASILFTSLLDTNNLILPRLEFLGLTRWSSWEDYDLEDLKRDFSLRRSNVQLSVSEA